MPGLLVAAAVAATLSATPPAHRADVKPRLRTSAQLTTSLATDTTSIRKVCGMPMVIGDASVDRGILIDPSRDRNPERKTPSGDSGCGSLKLVKPVIGRR